MADIRDKAYRYCLTIKCRVNRTGVPDRYSGVYDIKSAAKRTVQKYHNMTEEEFIDEVENCVFSWSTRKSDTPPGTFKQLLSLFDLMRLIDPEPLAIPDHQQIGFRRRTLQRYYKCNNTIKYRTTYHKFPFIQNTLRRKYNGGYNPYS